MTSIETALRAELTAAMRRRDSAAVAVLRTTIGALGNAEAVPVAGLPARTTSEHVAGAHVGLGAAEAERRALSDDEAVALVRAEIDERLAAAAALDALGQESRAQSLRDEADVLRDVLDARG